MPDEPFCSHESRLIPGVGGNHGSRLTGSQDWDPERRRDLARLVRELWVARGDLPARSRPPSFVRISVRLLIVAVRSGNDLAHDRQRFLDLRGAHVEVRAGARPRNVSDTETVTPCGRSRAANSAAVRPVPLVSKNTRLVSGGLDGDARDLGHAPRQGGGVGVVLGQAVDVVLQGVDTGGGVHAALAHRAAEPLLPAPGLADELF